MNGLKTREQDKRFVPVPEAVKDEYGPEWEDVTEEYRPFQEYKEDEWEDVTHEYKEEIAPPREIEPPKAPKGLRPAKVGLGVAKSVGKTLLRFGPNLAKILDQTIGFAGGTLESTAKTMGEVTALEGMFKPYEKAGKVIKDWGLQAAEDIQGNILETQDWLNLPKEKRGRLIENLNYLADPEWLAFNIGDAAQSMGAMVAATVYAGPGAGMAVAGAMEAGDLYGNLIKDGIDHEVAALATLSFGTVVATLNRIGLRQLAKKPVGNILKNIANRFTGGAVEATTEYMEEPFEAVFNALARGKNPKEIGSDVIQSLKNIDVIPGSFVLGAGMAGKAPLAPPTDKPTDLLDIVEPGAKYLKAIGSDVKKGLITPEQLQDLGKEFRQKFPQSTKSIQEFDSLIEAQAQLQPIEPTEVVEEGAIPLEEVMPPEEAVIEPEPIEIEPEVLEPVEEPVIEEEIIPEEAKLPPPELEIKPTVEAKPEEVGKPIPEVKKPWEMSKDEWLRSKTADEGQFRLLKADKIVGATMIKAQHEVAVRDAISEGKITSHPDYPELGKVEPTTQEIDKAAKETETDLTEAQKKTGKYEKGRINLHGFDIDIENPKGSVRSGVDRQGKKWSIKLKHHYGEILGVKGKDKDWLDVFIGPNPESDKIFVIDQVDPETGNFDEHKILMGFPTEKQARVGYLANYERAWKGLGEITELTVDEFKEWTKTGDTTKAIGEVIKEPPEIEVIPYSKDLDIRNIEALPRGTGARYLEVIRGEKDEYIAKLWRRKATDKGILIDFKPTEVEIPPRPLVNPKATYLQQDKQLRKQQAWDKKYGEIKKKPTPEEARAKATEVGRKARETQLKKAASQKYLVPWIAASGGIKPLDLSGEIRDIIWTRDAKGKKKIMRGIPPGFLSGKGRTLDVIVTEANEAGFSVRDDNQLIELIEKDLTAASTGDIKGRVGKITTELTTQEEFNEGLIEHERQKLRDQGYTEEQIKRAEEGIETEEVVSPEEKADPDKAYQDLKDFFEEAPFELKPTEPTPEEKIAIGKERGEIVAPEKAKKKPVIPTEKIPVATKGEQVSLLPPVKGEQITIEGLIDSIKDTLKNERGSISFERMNKDHPAVFDNLVTIGKDVISEGHTKYSDFAKQMRDKFSEIWDKIRNVMMRVWRAATAKLKEETGAIYYKETKIKPKDGQWAKDYLDKLTKKIDKEKAIAQAKKQEESLKETPKEEDKPKEPSPYEKREDDWFGNKDWDQQVHTVEASKIQDAIKTILNKNRYDRDCQNIDQAIHIYLDIKRNPAHVDEYYDELTDDQKKIVNLAATIEDNPGLMKVSEYISEQYEKVGQIAKSQNVIFNTIDNYVARAWKIPKKLSTDIMQKFKTTSRHAKHRVFETILEGQAKGFELEVTGASNNLELLKDEISRTIEDKRLISTLRKTEWKDTGNPVIIHKQLKGYEEIEHPNFTYWVPEARIKAGDTKVYGPKFRVQTNWGAIKEGNTRATKLFDSEEAAKLWLKDQDDADKFRIEKREYLWRREPLYAPEEIAKRLNKILGVSKLKGLGPIDTITKYNAIFKSTILMTSLFHHQAFIRSYLLGTRHKTLAEWNPFKMYKEGLKAVNELRPEIELLVRNGLTLGKMQDWEESILRSEANIFGKVLDKTEYTKAFKEWANDLRERQAKWLFQNFGAGLKAQAALIEYRNMMKEQPDLEPNERAKMVAELINDDFGGLHLRRMGRDPTINHIYRLLLLAPDWTFSNVNTMWKAFISGDAAKTHLYRRFWASVITKGLTAMVIANILLSFTDEDDLIERFKKAWKAGHFRWLDIDVTPIYKLLGGKSEARKYFSVFGHFRDPMKFITHLIRSAKHKGSVFFRMFFEALTGTDWKGHRFTSLDELLGYDDKGLYLTETEEHKIGEPKGGRMRGEVVTRRYGKEGAIGWSQIPSYMIHQLRAVTPVQVQNFLGWLQGEIEGFDAIGRSIGAHMGSTYPTERKITEDFVNQWIEIKRARGSFKDLKKKVNEYNERQLLRGEKGIPVSWSTISKKGINIIKAERVGEKRKAVNY